MSEIENPIPKNSSKEKLSNNSKDIVTFVESSFDWAQGNIKTHKKFFRWAKHEGYLDDLDAQDVENAKEGILKIPVPKHHAKVDDTESDLIRVKNALKDAVMNIEPVTDKEKFDHELFSEIIATDFRKIDYRRERPDLDNYLAEESDWDSRKDPYGSLLRRAVIKENSKDDPRKKHVINEKFAESFAKYIDNYKPIAELVIKYGDINAFTANATEEESLAFFDEFQKVEKLVKTPGKKLPENVAFDLIGLANTWQEKHKGGSFFSSK